MKRRKFTNLVGLSAVAMSTTGFIRFNGTSFKGDCETTTDILGPFYRPDSPVRNDLVVDGSAGNIVELFGTVRHKDCQTGYKNAKVELWHCSSDEVYDNDSYEYRYRGTTYCDDEGRYKFTTQMPVPYDAGGGMKRQAHFHLMVSAPGYQSLITQIYFTGDPHLEQDLFSNSLEAKNRILEVQEIEGTKKITFDCNMNDKLKVSFPSLHKITGVYKSDTEDYDLELFENEGFLWMKNDTYGSKYDYIGDNQFQYSGMPSGLFTKLRFDIKENGLIQLEYMSAWEGKEHKETFTKI